MSIFGVILVRIFPHSPVKFAKNSRGPFFTEHLWISTSDLTQSVPDTEGYLVRNGCFSGNCAIFVEQLFSKTSPEGHFLKYCQVCFAAVFTSLLKLWLAIKTNEVRGRRQNISGELSRFWPLIVRKGTKKSVKFCKLRHFFRDFYFIGS